MIATLRDTDTTPLPQRLQERPLALRVYDATGTFDVTLALTGCLDRTGRVVCRVRSATSVRVVFTPDERERGSWRMRLYSTGLSELVTGPAGAPRNPYQPPVTVDLIGSTARGTISSCRSVYHNTLVCRQHPEE